MREKHCSFAECTTEVVIKNRVKVLHTVLTKCSATNNAPVHLRCEVWFNEMCGYGRICGNLTFSSGTVCFTVVKPRQQGGASASTRSFFDPTILRTVYRFLNLFCKKEMKTEKGKVFYIFFFLNKHG